LQVIDEDFDHKEGLSKAFENICRQLDLLQLTNEIPNDSPHREIVINRSLEVRTAVLNYVTINIVEDDRWKLRINQSSLSTDD
jgi:hypothetical protein